MRRTKSGERLESARRLTKFAYIHLGYAAFVRHLYHVENRRVLLYDTVASIYLLRSLDLFIHPQFPGEISCLPKGVSGICSSKCNLMHFNILTSSLSECYT